MLAEDDKIFATILSYRFNCGPNSRSKYSIYNANIYELYLDLLNFIVAASRRYACVLPNAAFEAFFAFLFYFLHVLSAKGETYTSSLSV